MKFRHEYKHRINYSDLLQLRGRLSVILSRDSHAEPDGTYFVKSLYFDNYKDKALREKEDGINRREKFRIRYYGDDTSFIRLEKKSKINGLCSKEHARITKEECMKIINSDYEFLLNKEENLFKEFYAKIKSELLRPRCIVAYKRECFIYKPGNVRITLDSEISGSSAVREFLNPGLQFVSLYKNSILEVKWDEFLPEFIQKCVQVRGRKASSFSKYAAVRY